MDPKVFVLANSMLEERSNHRFLRSCTGCCLSIDLAANTLGIKSEPYVKLLEKLFEPEGASHCSYWWTDHIGCGDFSNTAQNERSMVLLLLAEIVQDMNKPKRSKKRNK